MVERPYLLGDCYRQSTVLEGIFMREFHSFDGLQVFINDFGGITLCQTNPTGDDSYISIPFEYIDRVIAAIQDTVLENRES